MPKKIEDKKKFFPEGGTEAAEKAQAAVTAKAIAVDKDVNLNAKDDRDSDKLVEAVKRDNRFLKDIQAGKNTEVIRYSKQIAEKFGKSFSIHIAPMTYTFQSGLKTKVHEEHSNHIFSVFDQDIRAQGHKISGTTLEDLEAEVNKQEQTIVETISV